MNFIIRNWAKFGGILVVLILSYVFIFPNNFTLIESLLWVHLVTLLAHQFEEYVYPGGFKNFFNDYVYKKSQIIRHPLNNTGVIVVNVAIAWTAYSFSAIYNIELIWLAIGLTGITILNGIMHSLMFIIHKKYNPGLYTGFFLLIPFGTYLIYTLFDISSARNATTGLSIFFIGTSLIPLTIYITNKLK